MITDPQMVNALCEAGFAKAWPSLPPELRVKHPDWAKYSPWIPQEPTPRQKLFLDLDCEEAFYGGSAAGGKSSALLMAALRYVDIPGYAAILFRRTYTDLALPDALMDRTRRWLEKTPAKWSDKDKRWTFPSGATLTFGYLETEADKYRYLSSQFTFVGFDEISQFLESQYLYLFSRLRRLAKASVPLRVRSASNPGGIGAEWVKERFIPDGFTPEIANEERVFYKEGIDGAGNTVKRAFVPAKLHDNPHIDRATYEQSLNKLDPVTRAQLLEGDWQIRERGNVYPAWSDGVAGHHVITWSQFAKVFSTRHIPKHWLGAHGHDPGFDPDPRAAVWNFVAGANGPLAGDVFCIRELYANRMTVDEFAEQVIESESVLSESSRIQMRVIGHEASSEQATLARNHKLHYIKGKPDANGGIAQMRHVLRITDLDKPHPFKSHLMGRPHFYVVVDDDQLLYPKNERGMVNFRAEIASYRYIDANPTLQRGMPKVVPYDFFNHLCFAAGTMIETLRGPVPIEQVQDSDLVLTRKGYRKTSGAFLNSPSALVRNYQFSDGSSLVATPSHRIYADGKFTSIDALRGKMSGWKILKSDLSLSRPAQKSFISTERIITATRFRLGTVRRNIFKPDTGTFSKGGDTFMWMSGSSTTKTCRRATTFITRTLTQTTTKLRIWNVFPFPNISIGIGGDAVFAKQNIWQRFDLSQKRGMPAQKGANGTDRLLFGQQRGGNRTRLSERVLNVLRSFRRSGLGQSIAPLCVKRVHTVGRVPVYNLTVEGEHEYFANGWLVANCDAQRGVAANWFARIAPLTDKERIESKLNVNLRIEEIEKGVQVGSRSRQGAMMARMAQVAQIQEDERSSQFVHPLADYTKE